MAYPTNPCDPKRSDPDLSWVKATVLGTVGSLVAAAKQSFLRLISEINKGVLWLTSSSKQNTIRVVNDINKGVLWITSSSKQNSLRVTSDSNKGVLSVTSKITLK